MSICHFSFRSLSLIIFILFGSHRTISATPNPQDPLIATAQLLPYQLKPGQNAELQIKLELPPNYVAYADKFKVKILSPDGFQYAKWEVKPTFDFFDQFTKKQKIGVKDSALLKMSLELPQDISGGEHIMSLQLTYQACSPTFCLLPIEKNLTVPFATKVYADDQTQETSSPFWKKSFKDLQKQNFWLTLLFVFVAGFLTSLTPCIFPMIPITVAILNKGAENRSRLGHFTISSSYVLGIATTYASIGVIAAMTGTLFGSALSQPWVLAVLSLIFLALSLSMFGLFELQAPMKVRDWFGNAHFLQGHLGAFLTGLGAGIVASPCVGPVLVAILTFVAETQSPFLGFLYLFVFAIGMGQLFLLLGVSSHYRKYLPKSGEWMVGIKDLLGFLMFACAFWYAKPLLHAILWKSLLGLGLVVLASINGIFLTPNPKSLWLQLRKGLMILIFIVGATLIVQVVWSFVQPNEDQGTPSQSAEPHQSWSPLTPLKLKQARENQKPIVVDFFAEWCTACKELESETFSDPSVIQALKEFQTFRFDATFESEDLNQFKKDFQIFGLPSLLFFNDKGEWIKNLTLTGFERAPEFLKRLEAVKK